MHLLLNKIAIVTGAASKRGLGRATAHLFAQHGAKVVILDLDQDDARLAAASLPGDGHKGFVCDVTDRQRCIAAAAATVAEFGRIDILVNNAGITNPKRLMDSNDEIYDRVMDVNMRGTFHMTQAVVPNMRLHKAGSIVNMSSVSAQRGGGVFGGTVYSAAKAAILGYTKACARELGPDNIRVNAICPSMIDTDITGGALTEERRADILKTIPMARIGTAAEVAGCALFLASDLAGYVTGSEIDVNGGSHIH
jgi:NAD(P)-dependent dehydrogenase (short-subunit alcohol dehydrogenase family)